MSHEPSEETSEPNQDSSSAADRAQIQRFVVSNFRSLGKDVSVNLGALTVLVGPNGSGKSNVVDALHFIRDCMVMGLGGAINDRNGIETCRRWNRSHGGHPYNVSFRLELLLPGGPASYEFELTGSTVAEYRIKSERAVIRGGDELTLHVSDGKLLKAPDGLAPAVDDQNLTLPLVGGDLRFRPLFQALRSIAVYSIYPNTLRRPQQYSAVKPMAKHGENWVSILKDQVEETWKPDLIAALNKLTGDIADIDIVRAAGYLVVRFRRRIEKKKSSAEKWFDANQESDGTLRVAGIITALLQDPAVPVIAIEEPELTVHPGAIPLVADFLQQASHRSQVIVTTHSPELLDCVDASTIRVVSRSPERGTAVSPMAASQRDVVRRGLLSLGEVLRLEGFQTELPLAASAGED
ncbi:AAA family ATPase [Nannocystis pusilla]|uniref:AAA family ATPase n=1 Tax=Nannocystis pusilla TaxID=889268 RepID=A0ABS7U2J1_9BACT|nr:AAA family ATPase [Nannocystis pusilla]